MQMHAKGPGAGWSWLVSGFAVAQQKPATIFGAAVLCVLCMAWSFPIAHWVRLSGTAGLILRGALMLVNSVLATILMGGFLRLIDADRKGHPARALMVFEPFRRGQGGLQLALFGLGMFLVYAAFMALLFSTVGHDVFHWYTQLSTHQATPPPTNIFSPLPEQFSTTLALITLFFLFFNCANAIGIGQASLRGQSPLAAFRNGFAGTIKNALPMLVLLVCGLMAFVALCIALGILVALATLVVHVFGLAADHTTVSVLLNTGVVISMLLIYAFMAGVNYAIWHDVADGGRTGAAALPSLPDMQA